MRLLFDEANRSEIVLSYLPGQLTAHSAQGAALCIESQARKRRRKRGIELLNEEERRTEADGNAKLNIHVRILNGRQQKEAEAS